MNDVTLPQVRRMRRWLMHEYVDHLQQSCRCRDEHRCLCAMDCLLQALSYWAAIDIEMQWQTMDKESEGV